MAKQTAVKTLSIIATTLLLTACVAGISTSTLPVSGNPNTVVAIADANQAASVAKKSRTIGLELLQEQGADGKSQVVSPASLVVALGILESTATEANEEQTAQLLGASGEERDMAINALTSHLSTYETDPGKIDFDKVPETPQVHFANQILVGENSQLTLSEDYLTSVEKYYGPAVGTMDFGATDAKQQLGDWVRYHTAGLIKDTALDVDSSTVMTIQNAVVFYASWMDTFDPENTKTEPFTLSDGKTVDADYMGDTRNAYYAELDGWKMLRLPYDETLQAQFILPPEGTNLNEIDTDLIDEQIDQLTNKLEYSEVTVSLPKADVKSKIDLNQPLQSMGLTEPFISLPHLENNIVDQIVQQAIFKMDEETTKAAAVTEVTVTESSAPISEPQEFIADHPHLILITDIETNWDLFQVAVQDPSQKVTD